MALLVTRITPAVLIAALLAVAPPASSPSFVLATTTSVDGSGLLQRLIRAYENESKTEVHPVVVGSGKALQMGAAGEAQALITHDPEAEAAFVKSANPRLYKPFMWNRFILAGPASDPAGVRTARSAAEAFRRIHAARARFAARHDRSGTAAREAALWRAAGVDPRQNPNYVPLGQPMAALLRSADELNAYALSDQATFDQLSRKLELQVLFDGDPQALRNVYSVTLVRDGSSRGKSAERFVEWLLSPAGRRVIERFRIAGRQQFFPF